MALILARSPFYVSKGNFLFGATVDIIIRYVNENGTTVNLDSYNVVFRGDVSIDISPFIRDFFTSYEVLEVRVIVSGTEGQGTITETTDYVAVDGYGYYEEGANKDFTDYLRNTTGFYAGSNSTIYRNRKEPITIPLLNPEVIPEDDVDTVIKYYDDDELLLTTSRGFGYELGELVTADRIQYVTLNNFPISFSDRVLSDGGIMESDNCSDEYDDFYDDKTPNRVVISPYDDFGTQYEVAIVPVCESKYEPYKLVFTNKFGVREDLWFFKKSTNEITTKREEYKANTVQDYIAGDLSKHSYGSYNLNGRESMNMNTGFIPESFKENIRQLMLSETVWLDRDGTRLPVTIKNSQMKLKQSINEKLINYEIEIEFSYDTINNIS
tara:strand:+ start:563 stop:1708 length:1146 start_codon:yes stop_codon:yes gene_type:complete